MRTMASQITSLTIVYSTVYAGADQRKHQSPASHSPGTGEFPAQMAINAENICNWHVIMTFDLSTMHAGNQVISKGWTCLYCIFNIVVDYNTIRNAMRKVK